MNNLQLTHFFTVENIIKLNLSVDVLVSGFWADQLNMRRPNPEIQEARNNMIDKNALCELARPFFRLPEVVAKPGMVVVAAPKCLHETMRWVKAAGNDYCWAS